MFKTKGYFYLELKKVSERAVGCVPHSNWKTKQLNWCQIFKTAYMGRLKKTKQKTLKHPNIPLNSIPSLISLPHYLY